MTPLPDLLERAAGADPVSFDHTDVRLRVERRVRRQRALAAAVIVAVVGLAAGLLAVAGQGDDRGATADAPGAVTRDELTGAIWALHATSVVTVGGPGAAWIAFDGGGTLAGSDGCTPLTGEWELDGGRLLPVDVTPAAGCESTLGLVEVLAAGAAVGRFDDAPGSLELRGPDGFVAFRRVDRIGRVPTADDLLGTWVVDGGDLEATFAAGGALELSDGDCPEARSWSLDGEALTISGGEGCRSSSLSGTSRPRVAGDHLWLPADGGLVTLSRPEERSGDPTVGLPGMAYETVVERIMTEVLEDPEASTEYFDDGDTVTATVETESGSTVVVHLAHDGVYRLVDLASPGLALGEDGRSITSPVAGWLSASGHPAGFSGDGWAHAEVQVQPGRNELDLAPSEWVQLAVRTDAGPVLHLLARRG